MTDTSDANDWLTLNEAMDFLSISRTKIAKMIQKESLPAYEIGGEWRFRRSELLKWLEGHRVNH